MNCKTIGCKNQALPYGDYCWRCAEEREAGVAPARRFKVDSGKVARILLWFLLAVGVVAFFTAATFFFNNY